MRPVSIIALTLCAIATTACQGKQEGAGNAAVNEAAAAPRTIHAIMLEKIIPTSDKIWNSVGETFEGDKLVKLAPANEAEWQALAQAADAIVSGSEELQKPDLAVAPAGAKILNEEQEGALNAAQVQKLIDGKRDGFIQFAAGLGAVARDLQGAIKARDTDRISDLGGEMDTACESCHMVYWYPAKEGQGSN